MLTLADIEAAATRIAPHVRRTPVLEVAAGTFDLPFGLSLKLEFLQHAGTFKPRGAFNTMLGVPVPAAGFCAASGGNHGVAVAHAARALGHRARVFVPEISSPVKIAAIRARGAELVVEGDRYAAARALCETYARETGAHSVEAYGSWETMAGQGTVALEWLDQARGLDTLLVAAGGGGLVAGMACAADGRVRVVAVEPEGSRALDAALKAGGPVDVPVNSIAADSLGASNVFDKVYAVARRHVAGVVLVSDMAIRQAQTIVWRDIRVAAEPGGAAALAALTSGAYRPEQGERVGVLMCGANADLATIA